MRNVRWLIVFLIAVFSSSCTNWGTYDFNKQSSSDGDVLPGDPPVADLTDPSALFHVPFLSSLTDSPSFTWTAPASEYVDFRILIGTTAGAGDVVTMLKSDAVPSQAAITGLTLVDGTTYYIAIQGIAADARESTIVSGSGWVVDVSDPTAPGSIDDGDNQADLSQTNVVTWTASSDAVSAVERYEFALGTTPGASDVVAWKSVGNNLSHQETGLSLTAGLTYYVSVRAVDMAGNLSTVASSDGFAAGTFCSDKAAWLTYNASGAGTPASPYMICNAAQLASLAANTAALTGHYQLMDDIDLAPYYGGGGSQFQIGQCNAPDPWDPCNWEFLGAEPFVGVFDGGGYTISNFTYNAGANVGNGFFGSIVAGAQVKNLRLTNITIVGTTASSGSLAGYAENVSVIGVHVTGTVSSNSASVGGLIGYSYHVTVGNSSFSGTVTQTGLEENTGGLIGQSDDSSIFSSFVLGSVTSNYRGVGGLIGFMKGMGFVANSYTRANVTSSEVTGAYVNVGGFVGYIEWSDSRITNCYATGNVTSGGNGVGGFVGNIGGATTIIENSYSTGNVVGNELDVGPFKGGMSGTLTNSYYLATSTCTVNTGSCNSYGITQPTLSSFENAANAPMNSWDLDVNSSDGTNDFWHFSDNAQGVAWYLGNPAVSAPFPAGDGSMANPYQLSSAAHFNLIAQNPRWSWANYEVQNNIDFNAVVLNRIGGEEAPFSGLFAGGNYTLSNININDPTQMNVGLFGITNGGARIGELRLSSVNVVGGKRSGGLVGYLSGSYLLDVIADSVTVSSSAEYLGGAVGFYDKGLISRVSLRNLNVSGADRVGGLMGGGEPGINIAAVSSDGTVSGDNYVGGLFGELPMVARANDIYSHADVTATGNYVGGIVGYTQSELQRGFATGNIQGLNYVGGIAGRSTNMIENYFFTGSVTGNSATAEVGLLAGSVVSDPITRVYASSICTNTGGGGCNAIYNGTEATLSNFYLQTTVPLNSWDWDFTTLWTTVVGDYPILRFEQ